MRSGACRPGSEAVGDGRAVQSGCSERCGWPVWARTGEKSIRIGCAQHRRGALRARGRDEPVRADAGQCRDRQVRPVQPVRPGAVIADGEAANLVARLRQLPRAELTAMYEAATTVTECLAALAQRGANPVTEVLKDADAAREWDHYPPGDAVDAASNSQYYYHSHAAEERIAGEHGHFHTFVRPQGQPEAVAHVIGISTDAYGQVLRLFTTNRWVTGELWHDAGAVIRMLDGFRIDLDQPSAELTRWLTSFVRLFRPQIVDLVHARDRTIAQHRANHPERDVFEDRTLQVTSERPVDFIAQIRAIEAVLDAEA